MNPTMRHLYTSLLAVVFLLGATLPGRAFSLMGHRRAGRLPQLDTTWRLTWVRP